MGRTYSHVALRPKPGQDLLHLLPADQVRPIGEGPEGWIHLELIWGLEADDFEKLLIAVASATDWPVLGGYVIASDSGYVFGATPVEVACRLLINEERGVQDYGRGFVPLVEKLHRRAGSADWQGAAASDFVSWSAGGAPLKADPGAVAQTLSQDWLFAEDGVWDLCTQVGLAPPWHHRWRANLVGVKHIYGGRPRYQLGQWMFLDWDRFVSGDTDDGRLGIWDQERPGPPIETFPNPEGHADWQRALVRLERGSGQATDAE